MRSLFKVLRALLLLLLFVPLLAAVMGFRLVAPLPQTSSPPGNTFDLNTMLLFGLPLPVVVFVVIQGLKAVKLVKTPDQARWATIGTSIFLGAAVVGVTFLPQDQVAIITLVVTSVYGAIVSALGYNSTVGKSSSPPVTSP